MQQTEEKIRYEWMEISALTRKNNNRCSALFSNLFPLCFSIRSFCRYFSHVFCLLYFSWIRFFCYFVRFRFVVSEFSQHIQCLSLQPAHVGTCSHRIVRIEQKFKFFKKKNEQEYRKTPSTIDQILYLSQKNANECSFHFIYCNRKQNSFCPFFVFYFIFRFYCCLHENQLGIYVHLIWKRN